MNHLKSKLSKILLINYALIFSSCCLVSLGASASGQVIQKSLPDSSNCIYYNFMFDLRDTPDVEILNDSLKTESPKGSLKCDLFDKRNDPVVAKGITSRGFHPRPTILFVKWHNGSTEAEYQDSVDVGKLLPTEIKESALTFLIDGSQLNVNLVTREPRPIDWPIQGPARHKNSKVLALYSNHVETK